MFNKNGNRIKFSIFVVGFTTIITQIILLRDFLTVFSGIELTVGIVFSNWMLITALGAYLSKYIKFRENSSTLLFSAHLLLGILPILISFVIIYFRNIVFPLGKAIDLFEIYIASFVILFPFCIISGFLFTAFSSYYSTEYKSNQIYKVYGIEAMGAITGGLLFNFVFIFLFEAYFTLKLLLVLNFGIAIFMYFISPKGKMPWIAGIGAIAVAGLILFIDIGEISYSQFFMNQSVKERIETPYGNIAVTESSGQLNFYENGIILFSSDNVIANEENVHYAMLQHSNPENILLVSGGVSGTVDEVLKYPISSIDYVELDPSIIHLADKYLRPNNLDKKTNIINQDARLYLKKIDKKYDVVLINLPDPYNSQINRYYTLEFFEEIKEKLTYSGVISISLSGSSNYMSHESVQLHTAVYSTLKLVFNNVVVIPGQKNYFIASDIAVSANISELVSRSSISNVYVNQFYLDDELIMDRKNKIEDEIKTNAIINYDFSPSVYFIQMKLWLSKFDFQVIVIILIAGVLLFILSRLHIVNFGLFITGLSASSLEILLILAFQIIYGYVYFMLGIYISIFMIGILTGSMYLFKFIKANFKTFSFFQYLLGILAVLLPIILIKINSTNVIHFVVHSTFIFIMFSIGLITGLQFSLGTNLRFSSIEKTASGSYGADLLGSAFGALVIATVLIPLLGLVKVCLIIGIINFITGLIILIRTRNN